MTLPVACAVPLRGSQLIEAAAGTGKTWTIASLVVRLVATTDGPTGAPMDIADILVLTFTRAATRELVERIRLRLVQCRRVIEGLEAVDAHDQVLQQLLDRLADPQARRDAIWRLERAAAGMDGASVLTIDAWVQRMLREQVRHAGGPPLSEIVDDDEGWIRRAVLDYWRQQVYPLDDEAMAFVAEAFGDPEPLIAAMKPLLRTGVQSPPTVAAAPTLRDVVQPLARARACRLAELRRACASRLPEIERWLEAAFALGAVNPSAAPEAANPATLSSAKASSGQAEKPRPLFNGHKLRWDWLVKPLDQLRQWTLSSEAVIDGWTDGARGKSAQRLLPDGLLDSYNDMHRPGRAPAWAYELQTWIEEVQALPQAATVVPQQALDWVRQRLTQLKGEAGTWGFNDLLHQLGRALEEDSSLPARLRQIHPVALIDEFQDTSAEQFRVFDRIYRISADDPSTGLLLIGDPKQSIYRFRGADIHSYLQARRQCQERLHTLSVNFRSTPALIAVVNDLFNRAERRNGAQSPTSGAFLHGPEVPFVPADPSPQAPGPLQGPQVHARAQPDIHIWTEHTVRRNAAARDWDAAVAAERIVGLLNDEQAGWPLRPEGHWHRLRPRDCCVLVRTGSQAAAVRRALSARGVASAYLSERDLVIHSAEAREVLDLLRAIDQPGDLSAARRVWASRLLGLDWDTQCAQADDPSLWDQRLDRLARWRELWRRQGVLVALRRFVVEEDVVRRAWADLEMGERRLTNLLHLAEWLQEVSERVRGPGALINALEQAIASNGERWRIPPGSQAHVLRLESEADVVQIVTIHKSKGLQYPVVFLPFASAPADPRASGEALVAGDEAFMDEEGDAAEQEPPDEALEQQREDIRLLYVALTRAVRQLWIGAGPRVARGTKKDDASCDWHATAWGHLVSGAPRTAPGVVSDLQHLVAGWAQAHGAAVALEILGEEAPACTRLLSGVTASKAAAPSRPALSMTAAVDHRWRITSYSALVRGAGEGGTTGGATPDWAALRWDEAAAPSAVDEPLVGDVGPAGTWHQLDSSAELGQFLHELLEQCAQWGFQLGPLEGQAADGLASRLRSSPWSADAPVLLEWLGAIMGRPLQPWGVPLSGLSRARAELEFWLPLQALEIDALDAWCRRHVWPGADRPGLRPQALEGLLMGFADLVFRHGQRHAVLDYKSNRLGLGPSAYAAADLKAAVLAHRYDVQAAIYLLAVHRLLQRRWGGAYRPDEHLGPAQFLFLRGIDHPGGGLISIHLESAAMDELDALVGHPVQPLDGRAA